MANEQGRGAPSDQLDGRRALPAQQSRSAAFRQVLYDTLCVFLLPLERMGAAMGDAGELRAGLEVAISRRDRKVLALLDESDELDSWTLFTLSRESSGCRKAPTSWLARALMIPTAEVYDLAALEMRGMVRRRPAGLRDGSGPTWLYSITDVGRAELERVSPRSF